MLFLFGFCDLDRVHYTRSSHYLDGKSLFRDQVMSSQACINMRRESFRTPLFQISRLVQGKSANSPVQEAFGTDGEQESLKENKNRESSGGGNQDDINS